MKGRDNINTTRLMYKIRHKQDKTQAEELLLKYHHVLATISEILVSESKCHIMPDEGIRRIRQVINDKI